MNSNRIVIKYGGAAMQTPALIQSTMEDIVHLTELGLHPVIVHGGGPEISKMCERMGITPSFVNGLRVTDKETLEIAQMVLIGKVNKEIVSNLHQAGGNAIGLSGLDGNLLIAKQEDTTIGFVGKIEKVNPTIIHVLIQANTIPVIAPLAASISFQHYNINADSAAAAIAVSLNASRLVLLTDVPGILIHSKKIDQVHCSEIPSLIKNGTLQGGMIPKVEAASSACQQGVRGVHIIDGRQPNALLLHLKKGQNLGTTIYA